MMTAVLSPNLHLETPFQEEVVQEEEVNKAADELAMAMKSIVRCMQRLFHS